MITQTRQNTGANHLLVAYGLHLMVPAFLLWDTLNSTGEMGTIKPASLEGVVALISAAWLVAGLSILVLKNRLALLKRVATAVVSFYSILFAVAMAEAGVRVLGHTPPLRGAPQPYTRTVTKMDPAIVPGVSGTKTFSVNRLGLRGPLPPAGRSAYRILAIGGSTTICANLDDSEEWAHQVMQRLNASQNRQPVWVGNAGSSGRNAVHHLVLMQWMPAVVNVDMAIFLIGGADLTASLAFEGGPSQAALEREAFYQGKLPPGKHWRREYPRYKRLQLFGVARTASQFLQHRIHRTPTLSMPDLPVLRKKRAAGPVLPLPDLATGIEEYRSRIIALAERCSDLQMRCLFLTQPTMWRNDLSAREESLFWQGYTGRFENPKGYIASGDLARAMDAYNRTLLDTCRQYSLECYDIAPHIPKDTSAFFDEIHFNEGGAGFMARNLTEYLLSKPPFNQP